MHDTARRITAYLAALVWLLAHLTLAVEAIRKIPVLEEDIAAMNRAWEAVLRGRHHRRAELGLPPLGGIGSVTPLRREAG
jgi:hypothetical protein